MKKLIIRKKEKKKKFSPKLMFYSFLAVSLFVIWLGAKTTENQTKEITEKPVLVENKYTSEISKKPDQPNEKASNEEKMINEIKETFENTSDDEKLSLPSPKAEEKQFVTYIMLPSDGEIIKHFSDSELLYSKTLADYRTHPALDIKTQIGDDVFSPQNGKVTEIAKDEELGYSVTIDHGNMISKVSNLSSKIDLKVGDKLNIGQKIGICGDSAQYEIADEPHIHFELKVNGINVNPLEYLE